MKFDRLVKVIEAEAWCPLAYQTTVVPRSRQVATRVMRHIEDDHSLTVSAPPVTNGGIEQIVVAACEAYVGDE